VGEAPSLPKTSSKAHTNRSVDLCGWRGSLARPIFNADIFDRIPFAALTAFPALPPGTEDVTFYGPVLPSRCWEKVRLNERSRGCRHDRLCVFQTGPKRVNCWLKSSPVTLIIRMSWFWRCRGEGYPWDLK